MRKIIPLLLVLVLAFSLILTQACAAEKGPKPTIKLGDLNWGSAHFQAEMAKIIIENGYEYPVELVPGKTIALWQAMLLGEVDVANEVWLPNQQEVFDKGVASGEAIDLGIANNDNWQSLFVVPTYVIKGDAARGIAPMAPDLKSVSQLDEAKYKELFKNPENPSKGRIPTCLPGWECEKVNMGQLAAYGLDDDYDLINPGSQEALFASLMSAYEKGEPYITYLWGPTWIAGKLDLTVLEEPAYDKAVFDANNGCAYPSADIHIVAGKGFIEKAPDVAEMFKKWKMDTKSMGEALSYMDETGGEPIDAAKWFLKERENIWTQYVPSNVAKKVKNALAAM